MTTRQENALSYVRDKLREVRKLLDGVMYHSDLLSEKEFEKVRAAYDSVCRVSDQI